MKQITFEKSISKAGSSLVIPVTKEAKDLGYDKGDTITVTLGAPSEEDIEYRNMGRRFSNPNGRYANMNFLTPVDKYIDGSPIEDLTSKIPPADNRRISSVAYIDSLVKSIIDEFARATVSGEYATYSDIERSLVLKFNPTKLDEVDRYYAKGTLFSLLLFIVDRFIPQESEIKYENVLKEVLKKSVWANNLLFQTKDTDDDLYLKSVNDDYDSIIRKKNALHFTLVSVFETYTELHDTYEDVLAVTFSSDRIPEDSLIKKLLKARGASVLDYYEILGPFFSEEEAEKYKNFISLSWQMADQVSKDCSVVDWAREQCSAIRELVRKGMSFRSYDGIPLESDN